VPHTPTACPAKGKNARRNLPRPARPSVPVLPRREQPARAAFHHRRATKTPALARLRALLSSHSAASPARGSTRGHGCPNPAGFPPWEPGILHGTCLGPDPSDFVAAPATQPGLAGEEGMAEGVPIALGGDAAPGQSLHRSCSACASLHGALGPFLYGIGSCRG